MANETTLAWTAGFFDGEGCISVVRREPSGRSVSPYYYLSLAITQTDIQPLSRFQSLYGGTICKKKERNVNRQTWRWRLSGNDAVKALTGMKPWLTVKQQQAELAIDFQILKNGGIKHPHSRLSGEDITLRDAYWFAMMEAKLPGGLNG